MIKESNIMQEKNVIQKLQTGVISVLNRKGITAFHNFHHSDDPGIVQKHSLIIVKKIVNLHSSIRLKFHCKNLYSTYFKVFEWLFRNIAKIIVLSLFAQRRNNPILLNFYNILRLLPGFSRNHHLFDFLKNQEKIGSPVHESRDLLFHFSGWCYLGWFQIYVYLWMYG